jgi:hypothetical protein
LAGANVSEESSASAKETSRAVSDQLGLSEQLGVAIAHFTVDADVKRR